MSSRAYGGPFDLLAMQEFNAAAVAEAGWPGYVHVGDIPHRLYNGLRRHDPADVTRIWEDESGIAGWAMIFPHAGWINVQVRPAWRGTEHEARLLAWSEERLGERAGPDGITLEIDVWAGDPSRTGLLARRGWAHAGDPYFVTMRSLDTTPVVRLPNGYAVRSARPEDADALAAVHAAGFGSDWTGPQYRSYMSSPGYEAERELVVVAPDGSFAGFCVYWLDHRNAVGLFEPLASHPDHRRRGVGSALLAAGMLRMQKAGMRSAMVAYQGSNEGSAALYARNGFRVIDELRGWSKRLG